MRERAQWGGQNCGRGLWGLGGNCSEDMKGALLSHWERDFKRKLFSHSCGEEEGALQPKWSMLQVPLSAEAAVLGHQSLSQGSSFISLLHSDGYNGFSTLKSNNLLPIGVPR